MFAVPAEVLLDTIEILADTSSSSVIDGERESTSSTSVVWSGAGSYQPILERGDASPSPVLGDRLAITTGRVYLPIDAALDAALDAARAAGGYRLRVAGTTDELQPVSEPLDMAGARTMYRINVGDEA